MASTTQQLEELEERVQKKIEELEERVLKLEELNLKREPLTDEEGTKL